MISKKLLERFPVKFTTFCLVTVPAVTALAVGSLAPAPDPPLAPEIDPSSIAGAVAMLVCGALLFMAKGRRQVPQES